jgi:hypothetical protein
MKKRDTLKKHQRELERLTHFRCGRCDKWWSIGDAPKTKKIWYCPWCGTRSQA